jgi:hypothetical protein
MLHSPEQIMRSRTASSYRAYASHATPAARAMGDFLRLAVTKNPAAGNSANKGHRTKTPQTEKKVRKLSA